MREVFSLLLG